MGHVSTGLEPGVLKEPCKEIVIYVSTCRVVNVCVNISSLQDFVCNCDYISRNLVSVRQILC